MARTLLQTPEGAKEVRRQRARQFQELSLHYYSQAEGNLRRALNVFSEKSGKASVDAITALITLATALEKQRDNPAAVAVLDDAINRIETEFPHEDPLINDALIGPLRAQVPLLITAGELSRARAALMRVIECTQQSSTPKIWIGVQLFSIVQLLSVLRDLNLPDEIRRAQELFDTIRTRWQDDVEKYVEDGKTPEARYLRTLLADQKENAEKAKKDMSGDVRKLFSR